MSSLTLESQPLTDPNKHKSSKHVRPTAHLKLAPLLVLLCSLTFLVFYIFSDPLSNSPLPPLRRNRRPPRSAICTVVPWEGDIPEYVELWANSVRQNPLSIIRAYFIHHRRIDNAKVPSWSPRTSAHDNLIYLDITTLGSQYRKRGFAGYFSDRLCEFQNKMNPSVQNDCIGFDAALRNNSKFLSETKGYRGLVFANFLNPVECDSWAFIDVDTVFGDLEKYFGRKQNPLAWSADVWTIGPGDFPQQYAKGQFTAHVFEPVLVGDEMARAVEMGGKVFSENGHAGVKFKPSLDMYESFENMEAYIRYPAYLHYQNCPEMATMQNVIDTFNNLVKRKAWDEGCYSYGIIVNNYRFVDFTLQSNNFKDRLVILDANQVYSCNSTSITTCISHLPATPLPAPNYTTLSNVKSFHPIEKESKDIWCIHWIAKEYKWCVQNMPEDWRTPARYLVSVHYGNGLAEFRDYEGLSGYRDFEGSEEARSGGGAGNDVRVREFPIFHWQRWKDEMRTQCFERELRGSGGRGRWWVEWGDGKLYDLNHGC
ncbi:hypothetical protein BJ742DRAFT_852196 [Cladochytrium replicatum]|nr:hypothetical protein BJ742DRAFT_852196 [Cladochytrium replicatum]